MDGLNLTADDIVAVLKKTSLPTVLVEGTSDASIYRWVEAWFRNESVDIVSCSGRENLLQVFQRRSEFPNTKVVFLADSDLWCVEGVPIRHAGIIFTIGYSIENDVLDFSLLDKLLDSDEKLTVSISERLLGEIFSFEAGEAIDGRCAIFDVGVQSLIDFVNRVISPAYIHKRRYAARVDWIAESVSANRRILIRGKWLLGLYTHILSAPSRNAKYSKANLLELSAKVSDSHGPRDRLVSEIRRAMGFS